MGMLNRIMMNMHKSKSLSRLLLMLLPMLLLLGGCEKLKNTPVDVSTTPLVGYWLGDQHGNIGDSTNHDRLLLHVREDGYARYESLTCTALEGRKGEKRLALDYLPVARLTTVKLVLQAYPLTPKFEVTLGKWPDQNDGVWEVDGVELRKVEATAVPDTKGWLCY